MVRRLVVRALAGLFLFSLPFSSAVRAWPDWSLVRGLRVDYYSPALYLSDIFLFFGLLVLSAADRATPIGRNFSPRRIFAAVSPRIMFLCLLIFGANIFFSVSPPLSAYFFLQWLLVLAAVLFLLKSASWTSRRFMIFSLAFSLVFQVVVGTLQVISNSSLGVRLDQIGAPAVLSRLFWFVGETRFTAQTPGIAQALVRGHLRLRAYGTLSHPNILAGFLLVTITFLLLLEEKRDQWLRYGLSVVLAFGLLLTFSRSAWATGAVLALYMFVKDRKKKALIFLGGGVFAVSLILFSDRWRSLGGEDRLSWLERVFFFKAGGEMLRRHPLLGVGLGGYISALTDVVSDTRMVYLLQPVHNGVWLLLSELGIVGTGFLVWVLNRVKSCFKPRFIPVLLVVFLLSMTDHYFISTHQGRFLLATTLALGVRGGS
jgi:hypothetical protein